MNAIFKITSEDIRHMRYSVCLRSRSALVSIIVFIQKSTSECSMSHIYKSNLRREHSGSILKISSSMLCRDLSLICNTVPSFACEISDKAEHNICIWMSYTVSNTSDILSFLSKFKVNGSFCLISNVTLSII